MMLCCERDALVQLDAAQARVEKVGNYGDVVAPRALVTRRCLHDKEVGERLPLK
jgi:hypothetical protein